MQAKQSSAESLGNYPLSTGTGWGSNRVKETPITISKTELICHKDRSDADIWKKYADFRCKTTFLRAGDKILAHRLIDPAQEEKQLKRFFLHERLA